MKPKEFKKEVDRIIESTIKEEVEKNIQEMKKNKQVIKMNEADVLKVIKRVMSEQKVPGLDAYKKAHKESGKENTSSNKESIKKADDYNKVKGQKKPEFPHQFGVGEEKKARKNTKKQDEFVEDFRGGTNADLDYNLEPSKEFNERAEDALTGDPKMGNAVKDTGNTVETDTGKNMIKKVKRKKKEIEEQPMYKKDEQPTGSEKQKDEEDSKDFDAIKESVATEMQKMKMLYTYNKKTQ